MKPVKKAPVKALPTTTAKPVSKKKAPITPLVVGGGGQTRPPK